VIPIGNRTDRPDYDYSDDVTLQIYQLEAEKQVQVEVPTLDGKIESTFTVVREEDMIHVQRQGLSKPWNVSLMGITDVRNVEDAEFQSFNGSSLIKIDRQTNELKIHLG